MALELLEIIVSDLNDLLDDFTDLKSDDGVRSFIDFYRKQESLRPTDLQYRLRYSDVSTQFDKLVNTIYNFYKPKSSNGTASVPDQNTVSKDIEEQQVVVSPPVLSFLQESQKLVNERSVSIYSCKRPVKSDNITFDNIIGLSLEKDQLRSGYIYPFQYPGLFKNKSQGVLLYGPPGTGKTLIARAATNSLGKTAFFSVTAGEVKDKYVGETGKAISKLWICAQEILDQKPNKYTQSIIFIDEADDLAGSRNGSDPFAKDSVNELLQRMDGLKIDSRISVIAATNYPNLLDSAFVRRFDSRVFVDLPDNVTRFGIILSELSRNYLFPAFIPSRKNPDPKKLVFQIKVDNAELSLSNLSEAATITMNNIKKYGGDGVLSIEDIKTLVKRTGPSKKPDVMEIMKHRKDPNEYNKEATSDFGYSSSDIVKLVRKAVTIASYDIISLPLNTKCLKHVTGIEGQSQNYYIFDHAYPTTKIEDNLQDSKYWSITDSMKFGSFVTERILNFYITLDHFERALVEFPSTVDIDEYKALVNYKFKI